MVLIQGNESIVNPLQRSALNKKSLCDYVINVASGCVHGCTFCYVPSTPAIRTKQAEFIKRGVDNPQMDWGDYLFVREEVPEKLEHKLSRQRSWYTTPSGRGVVLLCSGTDPYQNTKVAEITRKTVEVLLAYGKRVRILTRSPLWIRDLDLLNHPDVIVGMSIPCLDDTLSRQIEPKAPLPSDRIKALIMGREAGCRIYIAMAPTHPYLGDESLEYCLESFRQIDPEVIFWEPINARGTNGKRMLKAGLTFASSIMEQRPWAMHFIQQWIAIESAAERIGILDKIHIWPDRELKRFVDHSILEYWWNKPTSEVWQNVDEDFYSNPSRSYTIQQLVNSLHQFRI
jgi:DNA repair photolyase